MRIVQRLQALPEWAAYGMLAAAAGHFAAAFKPRWFDGHDVIRRMTFGGRQGHAIPAPVALRARAAPGEGP